MIRAYDDQGNVVDFVEWEKKIKADAINAIKNDMHIRLTEELNNPYQNQGLCEGLYFGIKRCDWYMDDTKEQDVKA